MHVPTKTAITRNGAKTAGKTNRELVHEACRRKALSLAQLVEATGLEKNQIRGVLNAPTEKDHYERTDIEDGSKLYRYTGPAAAYK